MSSNIILIDSRVTGYQTFIDQMDKPSEVFVIDAQSDGLAQIATALQGRSDIDALHIISHGSQGALYLGSTVLDSGNLSMHAAQLASIGSSLTQAGDILLYGCNVAQGEAGVQFINALAQATGADVAASSNVTGSSELGGDAVLERVSGHVETASMAINGLTGLLAINTSPGHGIVTTDLGSSDDQGRSIALQPDGKILVAGSSFKSSSNYDFALVRYNNNGSIDTSFSGDGILTTDFGSSLDWATSLTLQADGKILMAGSRENRLSDFELVRYNSNGSLDVSFSGDGMLTTDFGLNNAWAESMTLQADGKILVAGYTYNSIGNYDFALVRYNNDGSLDTSFGGEGKLTTDFGTALRPSNDVVSSIGLQTDGKILVAGYSEEWFRDGAQDFALVRYNSNGSLDMSFSGDGMLTTDLGLSQEWADGMTLQADGKILLAGTSYSSSGNYNFALVRYNSDGSLDTSFCGDGKLITDIGSIWDVSSSIELQADGKILVAGYTYNSSGNYDFALVRYNNDGSLDTSFGGAGLVITAIGPASAFAVSMTLQGDGKILLAGQSYNSSGNLDFTLVRYNTDGSLDTSFGAISAPNGAPTGAVLITGTAKLGQTLTATSTLADADGMGTISYQWFTGGQSIAGASQSSFTITQAQLGKALSVLASYTDGSGTLESVTSNALTVANFNTAATENNKTVTTLGVTDVQLGTAPKYTLTGADAWLFKVLSKGVLTFAAVKDYEQPVDTNHDGIYEVSVTMTNAKAGYRVVQDLTVGVEFVPINGTAGADTLKGTTGWDTLDGLAGDDKLTGGAGLDTFLISSGHDTILDFNLLTKDATGSEILQVSAGAVADVMLKAAWTATSDSFNDGTANLVTKGMAVDLSGITHGQGWNVTNAGAATQITGSQFDDVLIGGSGNDQLMGGAGNDVLIGGKGADILTGGTGADTFRLSGDVKTDHINDFLSGTDRIELDNALFKALLTEGQLAANQFAQGAAATTATQRIVYDQPTGNLWYDLDGSGKGKAVLIAVLDNHVKIEHTDFWVI